jgi:ketosteroid isomerase-like protein
MNIAGIAKAYLDGLEGQDIETVAALLTEDATIEIPFSNTGDLSPWFRFVGKDGALGYIKTIFENFGQVKLLDRAVYVSEDGRIVFVETTGDLVQRATNTSYRNKYIFKFTIRAGRVAHVSEYANPVTFAKLMGINLG